MLLYLLVLVLPYRPAQGELAYHAQAILTHYQQLHTRFLLTGFRDDAALKGAAQRFWFTERLVRCHDYVTWKQVREYKRAMRAMKLVFPPQFT